MIYVVAQIITVNATPALSTGNKHISLQQIDKLFATNYHRRTFSTLAFLLLLGLMIKTTGNQTGPVSVTHFVRIQVWVLLTQSEQERLWVPTQRLFGRDEVGPTDVETNPA